MRQIDKARVCKLAGLWEAPSHPLTVEGRQELVPRGQPSRAPEARVRVQLC